MHLQGAERGGPLRAYGHRSVDYRALFRRRELKGDQLSSILQNIII